MQQETKRQKQVGQLVQEELSDIFQRMGFNVIEGGMISISNVRMTPDLLEARVYLSMFKIDQPKSMLHKILERGNEIRRELGNRVAKQLRRVPELQFYIDDTLDHVFKMEEIFKKINDERDERNKEQE
ncbi:ribosome-binding factor A [Chitinophaga skermanii]|uniref:Ribosome-binding factor A n=1 Tax=Chitinophaga skermanii TaxID=331697 RepID=A0A327QJ32_9BACT|nr:30S ribosome-binding factor RbfA [Chitinophaga skermanii]RAJ03988.1 ribosome-binding factor A [Chitinophaga skermanii]